MPTVHLRKLTRSRKDERRNVHRATEVFVRTITDALQVLEDFGMHSNRAVLVTSLQHGPGAMELHYSGVCYVPHSRNLYLAPARASRFERLLADVFREFSWDGIGTENASSAIAVQAIRMIGDVRAYRITLDLALSNEMEDSVRSSLSRIADGQHQCSCTWFGLD
ncbi:MAG: hypothetical protein Q7T01_02605 [bacterium]|nr:hypothetical protein [bacterium]